MDFERPISFQDDKYKFQRCFDDGTSGNREDLCLRCVPPPAGRGSFSLALSGLDCDVCWGGLLV